MPNPELLERPGKYIWRELVKCSVANDPTTTPNHGSDDGDEHNDDNDDDDEDDS